jgi:dTDP-4-amino-4,6-dideoxygalactose transaminase
VKAPQLAAWTEARRLNAERYRRLFRESAIADSITPPIEPPEYRHIYNQFVIRLAERDALKAHLDAHGVGNEIYYPVPFHLQPCFAYLGHAEGEFPVAEAAARQSLAIPIYGELTADQQQQVVDTIAQFTNMRAGAV